MKSIPNELSARFADIEGRKELIEKYGNSKFPFTGVNEDGEMVNISIDTESGIVLETYQKNGWVRVNYYDKDGFAEGESFNGRWDK